MKDRRGFLRSLMAVPVAAAAPVVLLTPKPVPISAMPVVVEMQMSPQAVRDIVIPELERALEQNTQNFASNLLKALRIPSR